MLHGREKRFKCKKKRVMVFILVYSNRLQNFYRIMKDILLVNLLKVINS